MKTLDFRFAKNLLKNNYKTIEDLNALLKIKYSYSGDYQLQFCIWIYILHIQEEEICSFFTLEKGLELRCWYRPGKYEVSINIYVKRKQLCVYDAERFILKLNID